MRIQFHPEAELEFGDAIRWYEYQRKGLGSEFLLCIDEAIEKIKRTPQLFPTIHKNIRRVVVRRFPFAVFMKKKKRLLSLSKYGNKSFSCVPFKERSRNMENA